MTIQLAPLSGNHLTDAAALVCQRYRAMRQGIPLLPPRYEKLETILPMLIDLLEGCPGVAALHGGRLVGFMLGFVLEDFLGKRSVFSPEWANAASLEGSRRVYEEMYARLAEEWVAAGCVTHLVSILPCDLSAIEGWHWLGFGLAAVDGLRGLAPLQEAVEQIQVRQAGIEDLEIAIAFQEALARHMAAAPTFWPHPVEDTRLWLEQPANALWLAYQGSEAVGFMQVGPTNQEACTILQDEGTASIVGAFTRQESRGGGVAKALLNRSLEWAREQGYLRCAVDFEPMNILAARFWMHRFEPVSFTLRRSIP
jgi:GNAT superfamily N-acetyltransferase